MYFIGVIREGILVQSEKQGAIMKKRTCRMVLVGVCSLLATAPVAARRVQRSCPLAKEDPTTCPNYDKDKGPGLGIGRKDGHGQNEGRGSGPRDGRGQGCGLNKGRRRGKGSGPRDGRGQGRGLGRRDGSGAGRN